MRVGDTEGATGGDVEIIGGESELGKGSDITFKYRFLFHEGDADGAKIAERYAKWAKASK